jgi:hypothetical protein
LDTAAARTAPAIYVMGAWRIGMSMPRSRQTRFDESVTVKGPLPA